MYQYFKGNTFAHNYYDLHLHKIYGKFIVFNLLDFSSLRN